MVTGAPPPDRNRDEVSLAPSNGRCGRALAPVPSGAGTARSEPKKVGRKRSLATPIDTLRGRQTKREEKACQESHNTTKRRDMQPSRSRCFCVRQRPLRFLGAGVPSRQCHLLSLVTILQSFSFHQICSCTYLFVNSISFTYSLFILFRPSIP